MPLPFLPPLPAPDGITPGQFRAPARTAYATHLRQVRAGDRRRQARPRKGGPSATRSRGATEGAEDPARRRSASSAPSGFFGGPSSTRPTLQEPTPDPWIYGSDTS